MSRFINWPSWVRARKSSSSPAVTSEIKEKLLEKKAEAEAKNEQRRSRRIEIEGKLNKALADFCEAMPARFIVVGTRQTFTDHVGDEESEIIGVYGLRLISAPFYYAVLSTTGDLYKVTATWADKEPQVRMALNTERGAS